MPMRFLAAGTLLIITLLFPACSLTPEQRRTKFVKKGRELLLSHDYARAALQFKNAIEAGPKNAESHFLLGDAYLGMHLIGQAVGEFRRAKELDPKHAESGLRLAQIMATSGDPKVLGDALERAKSAVSTNPESSAALDTLALVEMRMGKLDDAVQHLEASRAKVPANLQAAIALSGIRMGQSDERGAVKVLEDAIQADPKSPAGYVELGRLLERLKKYDDAGQQFAKAIEVDPQNGPALLGMARKEVRARRTPEAEQIYKRVSNLPDKRYRLFHAMFLMESGRQNDAVQEFARIYKDNPKERTYRGYVVAAYVRTNRWKEATKLLESGIASNPRDVDLLLGMARLHQLRGDYDASERELNRVLHVDAQLVAAHYLLSKVHEARGKPTLQQQSLEEVVRRDRSLLSARIELALLLVAKRAGNEALKLMDEAPKLQQSTIPFVVGRNWVLMALQDWKGLSAGVQKGLAVSKSSDLMLQDGLLKLELGEYRAARDPLQQVLAIDPGNLQAVKGIARSYLAEGLTSTALAQARDFAAARPHSAIAQHTLGTICLAGGKIPEARTAFQAAKEIDPDFIDGDISLAQMDIWARALPQARQTLAALLTTHPRNASARLLMGSVEELSGNVPGAIEQFKKVVELSPNNAVGLNNLAYLLSSLPDRFDEAYGYAERAIRVEPGNMAYQDTLGWILYRKGQYAEAVKYLEKSASLTKVAPVHYHLAMAYIRKGDDRRGLETLQTAVKLDPNAPEAQAAYALLAEKRAAGAGR